MSTTAAPQILGVETEEHEDGSVSVWTVWADVDRPRTGGYLVKNRKMADRLERAILAGRVWINPAVHIDVNGRSFVSAASAVLGRTLNADLKRLGF